MIVQTVYDVNSMRMSAGTAFIRQHLLQIAVVLSVTTSLLAIIAWAQTSNWHLQHLSIYRLFPVFGLLAFSLLLTQYVTLALLYASRLPVAQLQRYFTLSGYAVLVCIMLHPSMLIGQLWHDGFGLPPGSYSHFVAAKSEWIVVLGMVSLFIFLAYELHRWFKDRTWWKYVFYASDIAMVAVFYHGLRLGDELMNGWYRGVWLLYGAVLLVTLVYIRTRRPDQLPAR